MDQILYISLPVGSNSSYTFCHFVSQAPINRNHFFSNLFQLRDNLEQMNINEICFIGGEPLIYNRLNDVLEIISCVGINNQSIVTNGIGLLNKIENFNHFINRIDICRFKIDDWSNNNCFENINIPTINELEKISERAKKYNIDIRLVVPITDDFQEDMLKFVDMTKYLEYKSIVFRKIIKNINFIDFSFDNKLLKYDTVFSYMGKTNKTITRNIKGVEVICENICEETKNKRIKNNEFFVYHPNGILTNNWNGYVNHKIK